MVNCILLPDGKVLCINGARMGTLSITLFPSLPLNNLQERRDMELTPGLSDNLMRMTQC